MPLPDRVNSVWMCVCVTRVSGNAFHYSNYLDLIRAGYQMRDPFRNICSCGRQYGLTRSCAYRASKFGLRSTRLNDWDSRSTVMTPWTGTRANREETFFLSFHQPDKEGPTDDEVERSDEGPRTKRRRRKRRRRRRGDVAVVPWPFILMLDQAS